MKTIPSQPIFNRNAKIESTKPAALNGAATGVCKDPSNEAKPHVRPSQLDKDEWAARGLLFATMKQNAPVTLSLRGGATVTGTIHHFDRFTIALRRVEDKRLRLYFKHAIDWIEFAGELK